MARKLSLALALVFSILVVSEASATAIVIAGTDYTGFPLGDKIRGPEDDDEGFRNPSNERIGDLTNKVFAYPDEDGPVLYYTYAHDVDPVLNNNVFFRPPFPLPDSLEKRVGDSPTRPTRLAWMAPGPAQISRFFSMRMAS
jgi:hypothetical protein